MQKWRCSSVSFISCLNIIIWRISNRLIRDCVAVVGCADLTSPDIWFQRHTSDHATAGCRDSTVSWTMRCYGQTWTGPSHNCSMSTGNATGVLISAALPTAQYGRRSGNAEKQNPFGKAPHSYVPVLGHIKSDVKSAGNFFCYSRFAEWQKCTIFVDPAFYRF